MIFPTQSEVRDRIALIRAGYARRYSGGEAIRQRLWATQEHVCSLGGKPIPDLFFAAVDHRESVRDCASYPIPIDQAEELANRESNLQLACANCNREKGEADLEVNPQLVFDCSGEPLKLDAEQITTLKAQDFKWRSAAARKAMKMMGPEGLSAKSKKAMKTMGPERRSAAAKKRAATMGPERLSVTAKKAMRTIGPERLSAIAKKAKENMGPEKRSVAAKKRLETMGLEGRAAAAKKRFKTMGPEGRSAAKKKADETLGPEGRSAAAKKANETLGPEGRSDRAKKGLHALNHVKRGLSNPDCEFCRIAMAKIASTGDPTELAGA
jgi:HNH endonuclease